VTFANNSGIEPGDKIVLYAAGWGAFFADGTALSYPYEDATTDDRWRWRVDFALDRAVPFIHNGIPLQVMSVDGRDLRIAIKRRSHLRLSEAEYDAAVEALSKRQQTLSERESN
jgi:hypothetical protein